MATTTGRRGTGSGGLKPRPRQAPPRLSAALERAHRAGTLARVDLGAFRAEEARQFLGAAVDEKVAAWLYGESGGNPFYLQQLARPAESAPLGTRGEAVVARRRRARRGDGGLGRGDGIAVRRCPPRAWEPRTGDPFEPDLAAAAAAVPEVVALEAADELLRFDLVRRTEVPRRFRFRHPLVRRAVYESTPAAWRLGAHARCADVLATLVGFRRPNGRTISSTRRHKATRWRSLRCAKP